MPPFAAARRGMTANPLKPVQRYRPGKPIAEEAESSSEEEEEEEEEQPARKPPPPKASSFPAGAAKQITTGVREVKLQEEDEEGFVTEEEDEEEGDADATTRSVPQQPAALGREPAPKAEESSAEDEGSEEESSSEEEESSSEDEGPKRLMLRPTFIKKNARKESSTPGPSGQITTASSTVNPEQEEEAEKLRKEKANMLIRDQLEMDAAERAARKKAWDDEDETGAGVDEATIDDTDNLDPAAELAAWKLRELKRVKREREEIEIAEKEREEIERRRNLTTEEREQEDREFIEKQQEERESGRGKAGFMQKYFHKGAFFQPDAEKLGLAQRDLMGGRFADEVKNREALPEYLQVRDMTQVGRKGRTKYRDLKSEDTGRWGVESYYRSNAPASSASRFGVTDERFLSDKERERSGPSGPSGANASAVRDRRRAPQRSRSRSRSRSPPRRRRRSWSRSRSRSRDRNGDRDRDRSGRRYRRSISRSRSPPPRRDRYRDDSRGRRKRSPSPYGGRDKRRRVETSSP